MSLLPIKTNLGRTTYEIARSSHGMLCLKRVNHDGEAVIYFPDSMLTALAEEATAVRLRFEADVRTARMWGKPEPAWPGVFGDEVSS